MSNGEFELTKPSGISKGGLDGTAANKRIGPGMGDSPSPVARPWVWLAAVHLGPRCFHISEAFMSVRQGHSGDGAWDSRMVGELS